jgi:hypothetical protein
MVLRQKCYTYITAIATKNTDKKMIDSVNRFLKPST